MDSLNPGDTYTQGASGLKARGQTTIRALQFVLKQGTGGSWRLGWTMEIDLGSTGSSAYEDQTGCPGWVPEVGLSEPGTLHSEDR